nr:retrovirus-related Pol polyprotein from transposon TNT 1-94 [Tanacetum cinerariifolium]
MPPKPDLVFNTAPTPVETDHLAFNVHLSPTKPEQDLSHIHRPATPIIEDWVFDSKDESETKAPQIVPSFVQPVSADVPKIKVTRPRLAHPIVTKSKSPIRRHITRSPSLKTSNLPPRVTAVQAPVVSAAQGTQGKWFCGIKGIKKEFIVPRTPQKNDIAERKNRTLIEAARTMLADLLLPIPSWAEAGNTTCYVQNRVLVTKPHNKTPYELLHGRTPSIGFMRLFSCPVTILNTLDSLGKFEGKVDEGILVGYSVNSKAFRVFNSRTRIVQETLHVNFLENKPNIAGSGPTWLFDIDSLTRTMNYQPVTARNQTKPSAGLQYKFDAEKAGNYDGDAAFDEKEHDSDEKKPESEVNVSPSSSAQSGKQDDNVTPEKFSKFNYYFTV